MYMHCSSSSNCLIYPGEIIPYPELKPVWEELKKRPGGEVGAPGELVQFTDHYEGYLAVPGTKREDILVFTGDNLLFALVSEPKVVSQLRMTGQLSSNTSLVKKYFRLPNDVDAEFIAAHYQDGMIQFYIPRTHEKSSHYFHQVAVY